MLHEYKFKDLEAAADAMVDQIVHQLRTQIARSGNAVLAVGGGRTPKHVLPRLAARDCDWRRVTVTLTDDRMVPADDPDSNEGLVRKHLLCDRAREAKFLGLVGNSGQEVPQPDIVYLGFGEDAHIASLFPNEPALSAQHLGTVEAFAPVLPRERISLTMPTLLAAQYVVILIYGEKKKRVFCRARDFSSASNLPLARMLRQTLAAVSVFIAND